MSIGTVWVLRSVAEKDVALTNFGYEGFQPPLVGVSREEFLKAGYIPPNLENTLVTEDDFAQGQPVLPLSAADDQLYQDEWARFKAGVDWPEPSTIAIEPRTPGLVGRMTDDKCVGSSPSSGRDRGDRR
jgi:hypothetical protein